MKISKHIFFYEGERKINTTPFHKIFKGMGAANFIVFTGEKQFLIDSGMPEGQFKNRILCELELDRVDILNTDIMLLSHLHPDHFLGAKKLSKEKKIEIWAHENSMNFGRTDQFFFNAFFNYPEPIKKEFTTLPYFFIKQFSSMLGLNFSFLRINQYIDKNVEFLSECGIQVIELEGHWPGHVGFYFKEDKVLYSGDLLGAVHGSYFTNILVVNSAFASLKRAFEDLHTIKKLDINTLILGHGKLIQGKDRVIEYLNEVGEEMNAMIDYVYIVLKHENGANLTNITKKIFNYWFAGNLFSAKAIIFNVLNYLYELGKVDYQMEGKKVKWFVKKLK